MQNIKGLTDAALIDYYYNHHPQALDEIFIRYKDELFQFCLRVVGDRTVAINVLVDVYQRVWQKKYNRLFAIPFKTWLFTQAVVLIKSKHDPSKFPQLISKIIDVLAIEHHFGSKPIAMITGQQESIVNNLVGNRRDSQEKVLEAIDQITAEE